ncbi:hypothetical protein [Frondihabitans cladoniiphilus]|uniref:Uncharacterized protein n=1 Tax=Frondihabitans cladoniiphilus TaxID=715785 RepID=A0ABP8W550_9MICO
MEIDEQVLDTIDGFGRDRALPPLAWMVLTVNGHIHVEGTGPSEPVERWGEALGLDEHRPSSPRTWRGELGPWKVELLAA